MLYQKLVQIREELEDEDEDDDEDSDESASDSDADEALLRTFELQVLTLTRR